MKLPPPPSDKMTQVHFNLIRAEDPLILRVNSALEQNNNLISILSLDTRNHQRSQFSHFHL